VQDVVCALLIAYILILFGRMIFSWLPPTSGGTATVARLLYDLTEPVLAPMRRVIPPAGMFDLSFTVLVFGLLILWQVVCSH
jgi:YggT family protein